MIGAVARCAHRAPRRARGELAGEANPLRLSSEDAVARTHPDEDLPPPPLILLLVLLALLGLVGLAVRLAVRRCVVPLFVLTCDCLRNLEMNCVQQGEAP